MENLCNYLWLQRILEFQNRKSEFRFLSAPFWIKRNTFLQYVLYLYYYTVYLFCINLVDPLHMQVLRDEFLKENEICDILRSDVRYAKKAYFRSSHFKAQYSKHQSGQRASYYTQLKETTLARHFFVHLLNLNFILWMKCTCLYHCKNDKMFS